MDVHQNRQHEQKQGDVIPRKTKNAHKPFSVNEIVSGLMTEGA